ncbi:MAG: prepilin-type N-terminal cleavage/methylation domain-containing protein [Luteolibacter sp.]|nr:prepilin-type N-terminal cleavage/methylation domain-containing protein [Luteolibacter sp.]
MIVITPRKWSPRGGKSAFTLIEMVTVIAVIVTLLVAGVSLLGGTGAQARRAGVDLLVGMVEQARTAAITSRSYVVLAVAEPNDLPAGDTRVRLGLFMVEPDKWPDDPSTGIVSAALMSRWRVFENGVILIPGQVYGLDNPMDGGGELTLAYGSGSKARTVKVNALVFNPRGGLHHPVGSSPLGMRVAEGGYRAGVPKPNIRSDSNAISENRLKIGRVTARAYRTDG